MVSICHNSTKHIQCFGKCISNKFINNYFISVYFFKLAILVPVSYRLFQHMATVLFYCRTRYSPSTPDKNQDIVRHICTNEVQLFKKLKNKGLEVEKDGHLV